MYDSTEASKTNLTPELACSIRAVTQLIMEHDELGDAFEDAVSTMEECSNSLEEIRDLLDELQEAVEKFRPLFDDTL